MARIVILALAVCAVLAAVAAEAPKSPKAPAAHRSVKAWLKAKEEHVKKFLTEEKHVLESQWKSKVLPHLVELRHQLGEKWQTQAPKLVAAIKAKAGAGFDKALQFLNKKVQA